MKLALAITALLLAASPALATEPCLTVADVKANADGAGIEIVAVLPIPYTKNSQLIIMRKGVQAGTALVVDGCVDPTSARATGQFDAGRTA